MKGFAPLTEIVDDWPIGLLSEIQANVIGQYDGHWVAIIGVLEWDDPQWLPY